MAFTYFFRDLQTIDLAVKHTLPFLQTRRYINIWDAGCANGPEPYTLAIVLRENMGHMYFRNVRILASDIDGSNLFAQIIEQGKYSFEEVGRIPEDIMQKYFIPDQEEGFFLLNDEINRSVKFQKHDLLSLESLGNDFGLIICKNVLLHFNEQQRIEVIKMFYASLIEGGYLVFEQTQALPKKLAPLFENVVSNAQIFRKIK